jgi:hypothetical protein
MLAGAHPSPRRGYHGEHGSTVRESPAWFTLKWISLIPFLSAIDFAKVA